jgi:hypothetical protein
MSEGVSRSKDWSVQLPGFLNASWFVLVLGPTFLYIAFLGYMRLDPDGRGPLYEPAVGLSLGALFLFSFLAPVWLLLFMLLIVRCRGNVGRWLWLQAISMLGFWLCLFYEFYTHPIDM